MLYESSQPRADTSDFRFFRVKTQCGKFESIKFLTWLRFVWNFRNREISQSCVDFTSRTPDWPHSTRGTPVGPAAAKKFSGPHFFSKNGKKLGIFFVEFIRWEGLTHEGAWIWSKWWPCGARAWSALSRTALLCWLRAFAELFFAIVKKNPGFIKWWRKQSSQDRLARLPGSMHQPCQGHQWYGHWIHMRASQGANSDEVKNVSELRFGKVRNLFWTFFEFTKMPIFGFNVSAFLVSRTSWFVKESHTKFDRVVKNDHFLVSSKWTIGDGQFHIWKNSKCTLEFCFLRFVISPFFAFFDALAGLCIWLSAVVVLGQSKFPTGTKSIAVWDHPSHILVLSQLIKNALRKLSAKSGRQFKE